MVVNQHHTNLSFVCVKQYRTRHIKAMNCEKSKSKTNNNKNETKQKQTTITTTITKQTTTTNNLNSKANGQVLHGMSDTGS